MTDRKKKRPLRPTCAIMEFQKFGDTPFKWRKILRGRSSFSMGNQEWRITVEASDFEEWVAKRMAKKIRDKETKRARKKRSRDAEKLKRKLKKKRNTTREKAAKNKRAKLSLREDAKKKVCTTTIKQKRDVKLEKIMAGR